MSTEFVVEGCCFFFVLGFLTCLSVCFRVMRRVCCSDVPVRHDR